QRVLQRERQDRSGVAIDLLHEPIDDASRRTAGEGARQPGLVLASGQDRLLVALWDACLLGGEERGAHLDGARAERQRGGDTAAVHDAARGDAWYVHGRR